MLPLAPVAGGGCRAVSFFAITNKTMTDVVVRESKAQKVLSYLPLTLFFPVGIVYAGFLLFLVALIADGDYRARWNTIRTNPISGPILVMSAVFTGIALYSDWGHDNFWSGFGHYQTYLILLLFISAGGGAWQQRAVRVFIFGALYAATVYYLTLFRILPAVDPFTSYVIYHGNKSILLGILLAIAAALVFHGFWLQQDTRSRRWHLLAFLYLCGALVFIAKSRSGHLIFLTLIPFVMLKLSHLSRRTYVIGIASLALLAGLAWQVSDSVRLRMTETVREVQHTSVDAEGRANTSTGIRLQLLRNSLDMFIERPLQGQGIGAWEPLFLERYGHTIIEKAVTPHNDYLLYATEGGVIALGVLLFVWLTQLRLARRMPEPEGMWLSTFTVAIMVAAMFNAVLRDGVFAMAFMILLAIPLAGAARTGKANDASVDEGRRAVDASASCLQADYMTQKETQ